LFSKAATPPQTINVTLDAPRTIDYGEVVRTVSDLRKLDWVRNPFFVSPRDWTHALGLGVIVLKAILHPEDLGFMDDLREETFWNNLLPLIQGKIFSPKDRVREIMVELTGNVTGMSRPLQSSHARLQSLHDLPRYLDYMQQKYDAMEEVEGEKQLDRSKMDEDEFILHIVGHVKRFLPKVEDQYEKFLHDETTPFGLAMTWKGVALMERNRKINRKLGSTFAIDADGRTVGMHRMRTDQPRKGASTTEADRSNSANVHDPTSFFERNFQDGAGASLQSGLNYDAVPHGENFNPQRNLAPTAHGSTLDTTHRVARMHRAGFDREAELGRQSVPSRGSETVGGHALTIVAVIEAGAGMMTAEAMIEVEAAVGLATGTAAGAGVKTVTAGRCEVTRQTQGGVKGCETGATVGTGPSSISSGRKRCSEIDPRIWIQRQPLSSRVSELRHEHRVGR
jgi:hypothetical protein